MKRWLLIFGFILGVGLNLSAQEDFDEVIYPPQEVSLPLENQQEIGEFYEDEDIVTKDVVFETFSQKEKEELAELKKKNPQKFKEKLKKKREYLEKLRKTNPEKFKKIIRKAHRRIRRRLEILRKKDPEKFRKILRHRHLMRRRFLEKICRENPKRCEMIKRRLRERLERLRRKRPPVYRQDKGLHKGWEKGKHKGWQRPHPYGRPKHRFGR
jgi:hypothetical protein